MEKIKVNNTLIEYELSMKNDICTIKVNDKSFDIIITKYGNSYLLNNVIDNNFEIADVYHGKDFSIIWIDDKEYKLEEEVDTMQAEDNIAVENVIKAPMPGIIKEVKLKEGEIVKKGDAIIVLESMKVLNELKSPLDGVIKKVYVTAGTQVGALELLVDIEEVS